MKAALCFSGHCRNFGQCYESIRKNIIVPLEVEGFNIDIFVSTWDAKGHRSESWSGESHVQNLVNKLKPRTLLIEKFDRDTFLQLSKYHSDQWKAQPHLRNVHTSGDAVSMWFRVYNSWTLMDQYRRLHNFDYDVVFRLRPDIIYDTSIAEDMIHIKNPAPNTVYMSEWHGQFPEVTLEMMDHFAFGNSASMDHYMTLALFIDKYFSDEKTVHTGEGFLYTHLLQHITVQRIKLCYSVQRADKIESVTPRPK